MLTLSSFLLCTSIFAQNAFVTEWVTTDGSNTIPTSATTTLAGETASYTYNYAIEWYNKRTGLLLGSASNLTGNATIVSLPANDTIELRITGDFPHFYMNNNTLISLELIHVKDWGNIQWKSFYSSFFGCQQLRTIPAQAPDLSQVSNLSYIFASAYALTADLSTWDVSTITNMRAAFSSSRSFTSDLSAWDVSNVTNMQYMFTDAQSFNSDLSSWDVSNVTNMQQMFNGATVFNSDLSAWNVSNVTDMQQMFNNAIAFNSDLSAWDISNVTTMANIFNQSGISYCNMDNILNAWTPILNSQVSFISPINYASINSEAARTLLGNKISLINPQIQNPISTTFETAIPTTLLCPGENITLTASGADTYEWNNIAGTATNTFTITTDTTIMAKGIDALGCFAIDTLNILAHALPTIVITTDSTTICNGSSLVLVASGADTYEWSTQETQAEITIAPTATTTYTVTGTDVNGCENTTEIEIIVETCSSINKIDYNYAIYPNPTNDLVNITVENMDYTNASISLMDITGRILSTATLVDTNTTMSLANYPAGLYFIRVQAGEDFFVEKVNKL